MRNLCTECGFIAKTFRGLKIHESIHVKNSKVNQNSKCVAISKKIRKNAREECDDLSDFHHSKNIFLNEKFKK
jgi:hypothetical protein